MRDKQLTIEEVRAALIEVADDIKNGRIEDFDMRFLHTCILAHASSKLGLGTIACLHWECYGLPLEDREKLRKLGFRYVTLLNSFLDFKAFWRWSAVRAINRYLDGKKRYWL